MNGIDEKKIFAVIMAGGKGERLWPLSTEQRPKPLIPLDGDLTLLEGTVQRLFPLLLPDHIFVIADEYSAPAIRSLLPIPPGNVIAEPCRRNTAPCVALATALVKRKSPDAVIIMLPADHLISPVKEFQDDLKSAVAAALDDHLVTLGVQPTYPAPVFGYIRAGEEISDRTYHVDQFKEKPCVELAQQYLNAGNYFWNCGIFIWKVDAIERAFNRFLPALGKTIAAWSDGKDYTEDFAGCEKISIDYGIMEKADNVAVRKVSFLWSDVGTPEALYDLFPKDATGNAVRADHADLRDSSGNLICCDDGTEIRITGLNNFTVIKSGNGLLIKPRS